jgi:hypothetical protein
MVKKLISVAVVGGVAAVSACFGDAPMPSAPSGATILFTSTPPSDCSQGTYIAPVAVGSNQGYVSFLPFQPASCGGGGGGNQQVAQTVFTFSLETGTLAMLGSAGQSDYNGHVQIAANGSAGAWAYNVPGMQQVYVGPAGTPLGGGTGNQVPLGIASIGDNVYVATADGGSTGNDVDHPNFPNSGTPSFSGTSGTIWQIGSAGAAAIGTWNPTCGGIDRCMVAGSDALYYVQQPANGSAEWRITRLEVSGSGAGPTPITTQTTGADAPLGLDADAQYVAWSTTQSCPQVMSGPNNCQMTECNVSVFDTTDPMATPKTLFSTSQFACVDAKLADGYVYFSIVGIYSGNNTMFGRGIGRVKIADRTIETLDLGIRGPYAGPRRIFPVGDQLYLVDPLVMARIPKTALDGKHDFTP